MNDNEQMFLTLLKPGPGKGWSSGREYVPRQTCETCGVLFYAPPVLMRRGGGRFCSYACRGKATLGKNNPQYLRWDVVCDKCATVFEMRPNMWRKLKHVICPDCKEAAAIERAKPKPERKKKEPKPVTPKRERAKAIPREPKPKRELKHRPQNIKRPECWIKRDCETCGKAMEVQTCVANKGQGRFCSRRCFGMAKARDNTEHQYSRTKGGKRDDLDGLYVRSGWEANYARYLNWLLSIGEITAWEYEPDTFEFAGIKKGTRFYTPDFKITNNDGSIEYHEVKGWMDQKSATKLSRMAKYYPEIKIILIDNDVYRAISRQVRKIIPNWETSEKHVW